MGPGSRSSGAVRGVWGSHGEGLPSPWPRSYGRIKAVVLDPGGAPFINSTLIVSQKRTVGFLFDVEIVINYLVIHKTFILLEKFVLLLFLK